MISRKKISDVLYKRIRDIKNDIERYSDGNLSIEHVTNNKDGTVSRVDITEKISKEKCEEVMAFEYLSLLLNRDIGFEPIKLEKPYVGIEHYRFICECGKILVGQKDEKYCPICGNRFDWSKYKEDKYGYYS